MAMGATARNVVSAARRGALPAALCLLGVRCLGAPLDFSLSTGLLASDNVTRVPSDAESDLIATAGLDLHFKQDTRLLKAAFDGDFAYLDFLRNSFGNEVIGRFDGTGSFALIPELLSWSVRDDFGQIQVDPFRAITPENRQNVNYLSSGPDVTLRFGARNFVSLSGRYSLTHYQVSDFDSKRTFGGISAGRDLGVASNISLNAQTERIAFDNTALNSDYDRNSAFLRYEASGVRTRLWVNAGGSHVDESAGGLSGPLLQAQVERTLSPAAKLAIGIGTQLTDAADSFREVRPGAVGGIETGPVAGTSETFRRRYVEASWSYTRSRTTISTTVRWTDDAYRVSQTLDLKHTEGQLRLERQISPFVAAHLVGSIRNYDYVNALSSSKDLIGGVGLTLRTGQNLSVAMDYAREDQAARIVQNTFHENRVSITLVYHPARIGMGVF